MDTKWFVSNIFGILLLFSCSVNFHVDSHTLTGIDSNVINDHFWGTNENPGTGQDSLIPAGDFDENHSNDCNRHDDNDLPLKDEIEGNKKKLIILDHLSNYTEKDKGPENQTKLIIVNSEDHLKIIEDEEGEDDTEIQVGDDGGITDLRVFTPETFLTRLYAEKQSNDLERTKRQAENGGRRRRRCRCRNRRRRVRVRRRRRRRRNGAEQQNRPARRQRRRRGRRRGRGRRRCVCRRRGTGGKGAGGGEEGEEGGGGEEETTEVSGEDGGEEEGGEEDGGEEEEGGGGEDEGGEEEDGEEEGGDEEEGGEEEEGDEEGDDDDDEEDEGSDEESDEGEEGGGGGGGEIPTGSNRPSMPSVPPIPTVPSMPGIPNYPAIPTIPNGGYVIPYPNTAGTPITVPGGIPVGQIPTYYVPQTPGMMAIQPKHIISSGKK